MELRLLKMFCAVAQSGRLVEASSTLHLTPSALSHGIKGLEVELGCRLFERVGNKLLLNHAGEQLLAQVSPPLAALESAAESVKSLARWGKTRLRIGASVSVCQYLLPAVIRELKKSNPNLELLVESRDSPEIVELVRAHKVDLALGVAPEQDAGLELRPVFRDELMFVFAASHPWAAGKPISRDDLQARNRSSFTSARVYHRPAGQPVFPKPRPRSDHGHGNRQH